MVHLCPVESSNPVYPRLCVCRPLCNRVVPLSVSLVTVYAVYHVYRMCESQWTASAISPLWTVTESSESSAPLHCWRAIMDVSVCVCVWVRACVCVRACLCVFVRVEGWEKPCCCCLDVKTNRGVQSVERCVGEVEGIRGDSQRSGLSRLTITENGKLLRPPCSVLSHQLHRKHSLAYFCSYYYYYPRY